MKARRVVNLIRGKQAHEALAILKFAPQTASEPVYKLVASAIANARVKADASNAFLDEQDLFVSAAFVDEGATLKRFRPRAQGRAFQIKKRTSHITVVLSTPAAAPAAAATPAVEAAAPAVAHSHGRPVGAPAAGCEAQALGKQPAAGRETRAGACRPPLPGAKKAPAQRVSQGGTAHRRGF